MTDILSICEKYPMTLEGPPPGRDSWFLDYVLRSPKQAGHHLTALHAATSSILDVYDEHDIGFVQEFFGGMGAQALMVQDLLQPTQHIVQEYAWEAVQHLERVLPYPHRVDVRHVDAYDPEQDPVGDWLPDVVCLDFGDLTAWKTRDGEAHRALLDRVFGRDPKAVLVTDIACRYLHLHRERYEGLLGAGTCGSYETYLGALVGRLSVLYGYRLHRGFYDRWSTVMCFVPDDTPGDSLLAPTPESPVGLEIL